MMNNEDLTQAMIKSHEDFIKQYIPKSAILELIENETIDISGLEVIAVEYLEKLLEDK